MDEPVSQTDDRRPWNTRSARLLLGRKTAGGFAGDFEQSDESEREQAIGIQIAAAPSAHKFDGFVGVVPPLSQADRVDYLVSLGSGCGAQALVGRYPGRWRTSFQLATTR